MGILPHCNHECYSYDMELKYFSRNGIILPIKDAVIPLSNIEYAYGFGVYETVRVLGTIPYFIDDHIARLIESAKAIDLSHTFTAPFIKRSILDLVRKMPPKAQNVKLLLIGGPTKEKASLFILCLNPLFPDKKLYKDGATMITYRYERDFPHAKTLNMLQSYLAYKKARGAGAYDALLINRAGNITEGTRTNFFCIKKKTIYTPPEKNILPGIMRKAMLRIAKANHYAIVESNIALRDVPSYDGAFITSTVSKIMPVKSIDVRILKPRPEALAKLMVTFDDFLTKCGGAMYTD